jgi:EAL domain-containing protein (putative c-di-GMP-specific phosphodiesterase class I)
MGKSLQPQKATALRQPANTPAAAGPAATASNEPATAESLGWQLRAALPPLRLHSVSLWDEQANTLWLSEGALGPDEHNVVLEAIEALSNDTASNCYETGIEYGPAAIFLPVRSPVGGLVGLAMILADIKSVNDGVLEKLAAPAIRTVLQKVAVLLRPAQPRVSQPESLKVIELAPDVSDGPAILAPGAKAVPPAPPKLSAAPARAAAAPELTPQAVDDILEFELTPDVHPAAPVSQTQRLRALPSVNGGDLNFDLPPAKPAAAKSAPPAPPKLAAAAPLPGAIPTLDFTPTPGAVPTASIGVAPVASPAPAPSASPVSSSNSTAGARSAASAAASGPAAAAVNFTKSPAQAPSLADAFDLNLPELDAPSSESASVNVTQFPVAAAAPVVVPTAAPAAPTPPTVAAAAPAAAAPASNSSSTMTSRTLTGTTKSLSATSTSKVIALPEGVNVILEMLPFSKLRAGGRTRRFEVLPRATQPNRVPPGFDKIALQQLLTWMGSNRAAWSLEPTSFTLNLSIATLEDERFPQFVASNLKANGIAPDNIGFEIAEPLCIQRRAQVERFITLCDKLGCFVVIDDFSLDSSITSLLRSRALRLVKIDPKLTTVALKDKLAQAMVVAIAQAVKVLGIHCSAKRVDTQASLQWLTAIGADFAQGAALAQIQPLESLGSQPASAPPQPA